MLAALVLSACNASDQAGSTGAAGGDGSGGTGGSTGATGGATGAEGFGGTGGSIGAPQPPSPVPPGYAQGFDVSGQTSVGVLTVVDFDEATGLTRSTRTSSSPEASYRIVYAPSQNRIEIVSEGPAADGTRDSEARAFTNSGGGTFGSAVPNFAQVRTGTWSFAVNAMIDESGSAFRHNLAAAGGALFDQPSSGSGSYEGEMIGTIETFTATTYRTVPFVAAGGLNVDFASGQVDKSFALDPPRSNAATGTVTGVGTMQTDGTFRGTTTATFSVDGTQTSPTGEFVGGVAGPNQQEAAGVFSVALPDGGTRVLSAAGAFIAIDPGR